MSNTEYIPPEKLEIRLNRADSSESWGFRLQGGTDFNTPLSIQSVVTDSISDRCGLKAGDGILAINKLTSDAMTHDEAKAEIMKSGNEISLLVERGAITIWKPEVTPLSDLRPDELKSFTSATGEDIQPVQKTSLAINKPPSEPCKIGSSHNRSPQPFRRPLATGSSASHEQYSSASQQKDGVLQSPGTNESAGTDISNSRQTPEHADSKGPAGFRSVSVPVSKPPSDKPQNTSMKCGGCSELATGVIVKANNVHYHADCFKCTACSLNLKQKGFIVVEGKLYCETHAQQHAKPT